MEQSAIFFYDDKQPWQDLGAGLKRKIMSYNADVMVVKVQFEQDAVGTSHQHPHTQVTYVASGAFAYTVGAQTYTIHAGDSCYVPPNTVHGCRCIEKGVLIDVFSPMRADFLSESGR